VKRQHGFALVELLIATTLMTLVVGTTLATVEQMQTKANKNQSQNDAQERARSALDQLARDFRNGAAPAQGSSQGIGRATSTDVVFQSVDSTGASGGQNVRHTQWARYCLDTLTPSNEKVWKQTYTWTSASAPAVPWGAVCPDTSISPGTAVITNVVNNYNGSRPLFTYYPAPASSPPTATELAHVTRINADLFVDTDLSRTPTASELTTGIYLRDQPLSPTASFSTLVGGDGSVYLNGSSSTDPTSSKLTYLWCDTTSNSTCSSSTAIGQGQTLSYRAPSGTRTITLLVTNASAATNSTSQQVTVP
jgi:type II secretory pathway pseudopilin PulG